MKIAVFEYITGGGLRSAALPAGLLREGEIMVQALIRDLRDISGIDVMLLRDDRLPSIPGVNLRPVSAGGHWQSIWRETYPHCDAAWPIAPETSGLLASICAEIEATGTRLLTPSSKTIRAAASKIETARILAKMGLPVAPTHRATEVPADLPYPRVIKPDDGVSCDGLAILRTPADWDATPLSHEHIVQPWLSGESLSLSALFMNGESRFLSCNRQHLSTTEQGLKLIACEINAIQDHGGHWQRLTDQVALALPGLWGYAGIDLIMTAEGPVILEVNPRLTTSYAGICRATDENPAAMVVAQLASGRMPAPRITTGKAVTITLNS